MATAIIEDLHEQGAINDEALICERHLCQIIGHNNLPTLRDLLAHAERFGPDYVPESALHLSAEHHGILVTACERMKAAAKKARYA